MVNGLEGLRLYRPGYILRPSREVLVLTLLTPCGQIRPVELLTGVVLSRKERLFNT